MNSAVSKQKLISTFIIGVLVGSGAMWLWFTGVSETEPFSNEEDLVLDDSATGVALLGLNGEFIVVEDQNAGDWVLIERVMFKNTGWVVIREDLNGSPGNILGAQLFDSGEYQGVVDLLRDTTAGSIYYAMLAKDDGDRLFNLEKDKPLLTLSGNFIIDTFNTVPLSHSNLNEGDAEE